MKLMYSICCGDVVAPYHENNVVRWCLCGASACWWESASVGFLAVYSKHGVDSVSVIGIHNGFLMSLFEKDASLISAKQISSLLKGTPDSYLFKRASSLIVKFVPGTTGDTRFYGHLEEVPMKEQQHRLVTLMPR